MSLFDKDRTLPRQRSRWVPSSLPASNPVGALTGSGDMAGVSAGPGVGAIAGSGTMAGVGAALISSTGSLSGTGTIAGVSNGTFPVSVHASGRYLVRPDGTPFLICADTTWSIFVDLPLTSVNSYFSTLVSQGFNAFLGNAIEHHYTTVKPPKERNGLLPFTQRLDGTTYTGSPNGTSGAAGTQGQFASDNYGSPSSQAPDCTFINNSYWLAVEQILDAALANGLLVFLWPGYLGFHAGDEGWMLEMTQWDAVIGAGGFTGQSFANPAKSKMWNYGAWLAARWKNYPNLVWTMGGDYGTNTQTLSTAERAAVVSLVAGMKSVAGQQSTLWTAHWDRPCISDDNLISGVTWDINFCYCDEAVAELCRNGYSRAAKPAILGEYNYENGLFGGSAPWRKYTWWGFLGGIAGGFYGHEQLWRFDDGTPGTDWQTLLATTARLDAVRQFSFLKSQPWHRLKPSGLGGMASLITAGGGTASPQSTDYVAAAATPEGDLLLAYVPPAHTGSITVAMTAMAATCRARWFDPANSSFTSIGMIAATGTHAFTPPGTNSAGDTDFLLVLDVPVGSITGSGDMAGAAQSVASTAGALTGSGAITGAGQSIVAAAGALSGSGTMAGVGTAASQASGDLAGSGAIAAVGAALATGTGTMTESGALAGAGAALGAGSSALTGSGDIVGAAAAVAAGSASLSGTGTITGPGSSPAPVAGSLSGSGTIAGAGAAATSSTGTGSLSGSGTMAGVGAMLVAAAGSISASGDIAGAGAALAQSQSSMSGSGAIAGAGASVNAGASTAALAGAGSIAGTGAALAAGAGNLTGSGAIAGAAIARTSSIITSATLVDLSVVADVSLPTGRVAVQGGQVRIRVPTPQPNQPGGDVALLFIGAQE